MERRINTKITHDFVKFKNHIIKDLKDINQNRITKNSPYYNLIKYIYDYKLVEIKTDDLKKRKRIKNTVPLCDRCCALRSCGNQCTRRRKDDHLYCGTHIKGRPHGEINNKNDINKNVKRTVWIEEIQGINYYIDNVCNVYDNYDIVNNKDNPRIIAKYKKELDVYTIPALFKN